MIVLTSTVVEVGGGARWLSDREIGDGVLSAALAAVSGEPPRVHEVGTLRPWPP